MSTSFTYGIIISYRDGNDACCFEQFVLHPMEQTAVSGSSYRGCNPVVSWICLMLRWLKLPRLSSLGGFIRPW